MSRLCPECRYSGGSHRAGCPEEPCATQCAEHVEYPISACPMCAAMDVMIIRSAGVSTFYHDEWAGFCDWVKKEIDGDKFRAESMFNRLSKQPHLAIRDFEIATNGLTHKVGTLVIFKCGKCDRYLCEEWRSGANASRLAVVVENLPGPCDDCT